MNIDLLFTQNGDAGLIASQNFLKKLAGVVFDTESGLLTLEYQDMDYIELNIPVEKEFHATLDMCAHIHIGAVKDGTIAQAYQVPFMFLDDPYRMEAMQGVKQHANPLQAFDYFVKACVFGQPVHREDLSDDEAMGCILGDAVPSSLQFAPHLARQRTLEAGLRAAPKAPGPNTPGLGSGRSGQVRTSGRTNGRTGRTPPKKGDEEAS